MKIHKEYREHGLEILAFPCNQFMGQEPGSNAEIKAFAHDLYGAEFPLFAKTDVNGANACEIYKFLRSNSELYDEKKKEAREIPWNFAKFIVNRDGKVVSYHNPKVDPIDLIKNIEMETCHWTGLVPPKDHLFWLSEKFSLKDMSNTEWTEIHYKEDAAHLQTSISGKQCNDDHETGTCVEQP